MTSNPGVAAATPLEEARAGLDACVHCGFCLQSCPTYLALESENDSPRGRLLLMRGLLEGEISASDASLDLHISRCLGCRGCESACPSGVPYGQLLEATRATLAAVRKLPAIARLVLWVFERPAMLRLVLTGAKALRWSRASRLLARLPGRIGFAFAMLESTRPLDGAHGAVRQAPAGGRRVGMLEGCVMRGLFAHTNSATRRALAANGCEVVDAPGQRCCGALHAHAGDLDGARRLARANIDAFERASTEAIVVNAAGCGAMMKEYGHLLQNDPHYAERASAISARVRDVSEVLAEHGGPRPGQGADSRRVAYDPPCHLLHAQRIARQPLDVLQAIPGLTLTPLAEAEQCCGAAGIYNLMEPDVSNAVLERKLRHIIESRVDLVATGNPGCLM